MLKFLSKSKEGLKKISLKTFCQKSDFFSFSLPAIAAARVFSHSVFSLLSLHRSNGLLAFSTIICTPPLLSPSLSHKFSANAVR